MYSRSRGILYTAPPGPDDEREDETGVETTTDVEDGAPSEARKSVAADD